MIKTHWKILVSPEFGKAPIEAGFRGENPPTDLLESVSGFGNPLLTRRSSRVGHEWVGSDRVWSVGWSGWTPLNGGPTPDNREEERIKGRIVDTTTQMGEGRDIGPKISGGPTDIIGWPILSMLLLETLLY